MSLGLVNSTDGLLELRNLANNDTDFAGARDRRVCPVALKDHPTEAGMHGDNDGARLTALKLVASYSVCEGELVLPLLDRNGGSWATLELNIHVVAGVGRVPDVTDVTVEDV